MKRTIALLIMLCLILPSILAIAESTFPIVNEPLTIEVATWRRDGQVDYNDMLLCPYGIITTNRKSPVYQGISVIWQGFSSFSKPKNQAAK